MKTRPRLAIKIGIGAMLLVAQGHATQTAEIQVLGVSALRISLDLIVAEFERATGGLPGR